MVLTVVVACVWGFIFGASAVQYKIDRDDPWKDATVPGIIALISFAMTIAWWGLAIGSY